MSKAVLLSIRPQYCELIADGEKTIEVRKTRPKIDTPFKCYVYQTMTGYVSKSKENDVLVPVTYGKVIGEFVCDEMETYVKVGYSGVGKDPEYMSVSADFRTKKLPLEQILLTYEQFYEYADDAKIFGWHISNLTIYDEPKELSEFVTEGDCDCMNCAKCAWLDKGNSAAEIEDDCELAYVNVRDGVNLKPIFRAPQSWCYVEELT